MKLFAYKHTLCLSLLQMRGYRGLATHRSGRLPGGREAGSPRSFKAIFQICDKLQMHLKTTGTVLIPTSGLFGFVTDGLCRRGRSCCWSGQCFVPSFRSEQGIDSCCTHCCFLCQRSLRSRLSYHSSAQAPGTSEVRRLAGSHCTERIRGSQHWSHHCLCSLTPASFQHAGRAPQGPGWETPTGSSAAWQYQQRAGTCQARLNTEPLQNTKDPY